MDRWHASRRKYHFIYKTTCKVNGKFYYGMHSTDDLNDGYIGSGTQLSRSIKKHGRENFSMEILEFLPDREALKKREAELITEELLHDPMCMNLTLGGGGGWFTYNNTMDFRELQKRRGSKGAHKTNKTYWTPEKHSIANKRAYLNGRVRIGWGDAAGEVAKSPESIEKRKATYKHIGHQQGSKNSQAGTLWITDGVTSKKIKVQEPLPPGWRKGRVIKSIPQ
jgi:hypothetical protein